MKHTNFINRKVSDMSKFLEDISAFIKENNYTVYRVAEIKDGGEPEVVTTIPTNACQNSYSVAKAFVVTAIGILYDRGLIKPEDRITEILSEECPDDVDPRWHEITVHDALLHRLGLPGGFLDIDTHKAEEFGRDYLTYMFKYPFDHEPRVQRSYTDGAYYMLARIVEKKAGMPIDNFLWDTLFYPLGFQEMAWSRCPMGHPMGATGLYIRTKDMVKLGQVYLSGGMYGDTRIVSEEWVNLTLQNGYELNKMKANTYGKGGMNGQQLWVFPEKNRVVAWHGYTRHNSDMHNWILAYEE